MDDFKIALNRSLQFKLSAWLFTVITVIALAGSALSFVFAFNEANDLQDDQLRQVVALFHKHVVPVAPLESEDPALDTEPEFRVLVEIVGAQGIEVLGSRHPQLVLPADTQDGLQTRMIDKVQWRLLVKTFNSQQRLVVAQKIAVRDMVALESATTTLIPYIILIPLLLFIISYLVRRMFKPVALLAADLDERSEDDLQEINQLNLPAEILPFVAAINRMLTRVNESVMQQKRFVADAAHEMRTPLTALSLQVERLEVAENPEQMKARLAILKSGILRTQALLNQLLALARAQQAGSQEKTVVSIQHVFRRVLEELMPLADSKHIDLGVANEIDAYLDIQEIDLIILIRNLVDNAIRYTPERGQIDLSVQLNKFEIIIQIDDTGPGIAKEERTRVFDPFYRVIGNDTAGSGLGLSIVKAIATRIGAQVHLGNSAAHGERSGLCVSIVIPWTKNTF